jgi:hypothetical protein
MVPPAPVAFYVGELSIVSFRPDMVTCRRVYELAGDAYPLAALADTSFKDIAHTKFAPQMPYVHDFPFIGKSRIASDHKEPSQPL